MNKLKNNFFVFLFIFLSIVPIISLFYPGLPWTHDGQDHVIRIANFYQNLTEGNLIPRWGENLNWGYGHPVLEFLYPLPSYIASILHFIGLSLVDSTKIVFALGMVMSFYFMYLCLSSFISKYPALFGAVLYTYAPYRFVETYVRGDVGENLAFAFVPLVLYFIYKLYKEQDYRYTVLGGISLSLLILAHNAISLMFMPLIIIYGLILVYLSKFNKSFILNYLIVILIGFFLSAFFWIPALLEGKYTLRNIVTKGGYLNNFVSLQRIIYSNWSFGGTKELSVQLGIFQWLSLIFSPILLLKAKKNKYVILLSTLMIVSTLFSIFIMLPISDFIWSRIILLQNFQFPWRFVAITVLSTAVLGGLLFEKFSEKFNVKYLTLFSILCILFISSFYWSPKAYLFKPESFYKGVYNGTTDTGESAPIWSVRFMEKKPNAHMEVIDGDAKIKELERLSTYHRYKVMVNKTTLFRENTLYFPGWEIVANGKPLRVEFQNQQYRGVMLFSLDKGEYVLEAKYKETRLRLFSDLISLLSISGILLFLAFRFVKAKLY